MEDEHKLWAARLTRPCAVAEKEGGSFPWAQGPGFQWRASSEVPAAFQKILDHKGRNWGPLYSLAWLGMARTSALEGDSAKARPAYQDFLDLWKDADPDIPILISARKEYAVLSITVTESGSPSR
jgi:hypothetical protein